MPAKKLLKKNAQVIKCTYDTAFSCCNGNELVVLKKNATDYFLKLIVVNNRLVRDLRRNQQDYKRTSAVTMTEENFYILTNMAHGQPELKALSLTQHLVTNAELELDGDFEQLRLFFDNNWKKILMVNEESITVYDPKTGKTFEKDHSITDLSTIVGNEGQTLFVWDKVTKRIKFFDAYYNNYYEYVPTELPKAVNVKKVVQRGNKLYLLQKAPNKYFIRVFDAKNRCNDSFHAIQLDKKEKIMDLQLMSGDAQSACNLINYFVRDSCIDIYYLKKLMATYVVEDKVVLRTLNNIYCHNVSELSKK